MIPKIIHYCWFGNNDFPDLAKRCLNSWRTTLPEYKIIRWDESNFNVNCNEYIKQAYNAKKYAFVTDYVRLFVLVHFGGIYMDTDVEVLKPLDDFLKYEAFSGFENELFIPTGIMASVKDYSPFKELMGYYNSAKFLKDDGKFNLTTNVTLITEYFEKKGLIKNDSEQIIDGFKLMPSIFFCPAKEDISKKYISQIYTIHHKLGSWLPNDVIRKDNTIIKSKRLVKKYLKLFLGRSLYQKIYRFVYKMRRIKTYAERN